MIGPQAEGLVVVASSDPALNKVVLDVTALDDAFLNRLAGAFDPSAIAWNSGTGTVLMTAAWEASVEVTTSPGPSTRGAKDVISDIRDSCYSMPGDINRCPAGS